MILKAIYLNFSSLRRSLFVFDTIVQMKLIAVEVFHNLQISFFSIY